MEPVPIEIYVCRCDSLPVAEAAPLLSPARRERCDHLPADDARRSAAAGLLLRHACRTLLGAEPGEEVRDENGRPHLPAHPDFFFSLSHSGSFALCAAGFSPAGADVQAVRPVSDALLRRFFSAEERALCTDAESAIRVWCARESFGKLTGRGLSRDDHITSRGGALWIGGYRVSEPHISDGYCAAVCSAAPVHNAPVFLTLEALLCP